MTDHESSILKITFDPGGADELVILDWEQRGGTDLFPWKQQVAVEPFIQADFQGIFPRGNTERVWPVETVHDFATFEALVAAHFARDISIPRTKKELHVRILDLTTNSGDSEATRTSAHYKTTSCSIESMTPSRGPKPLQITRLWSLRIGAFTEVV